MDRVGRRGDKRRERLALGLIVNFSRGRRRETSEELKREARIRAGGHFPLLV